MTQPSSVISPDLLAIIESLPTHPRSGDLLGAFIRAERLGFERGQRERQVQDQALDRAVSTFLRRQAG